MIEKRCEKCGAETRRFVRNPQIMGGVLCFEGTRIPVYAIKEYGGAGYSAKQVIAEYPDLSLCDVLAAFAKPASCYDCDAAHGSWPDYYVEPEIWEAYGPFGHDGGLLCLNCLAQRMAVRANERRAEVGVRINPTLAAKITGTADIDPSSDSAEPGE